MEKAVPNVLYKYRHFDERSMKLICGDLVYYADPNTFNDPLDTKPCVEADCDVQVLEHAVSELVRRRIESALKANARAIRYRGPRTMDHIAKLARSEADQNLKMLRYQATDPENVNQAEAYVHLLSYAMERELLHQSDKGILSLAKRYNCPLMWSHYGNQHGGLCIGYSVPVECRSNIHRVIYGGNRKVSAKAVAQMVSGDADARVAVDEAVLLRKAQDWRYEKEWRLLGPRGERDSPLELVEIIFGMRCDQTVIHTVASALEGRARPVKLYQMQEVAGTFGLKRAKVDLDELSVYYPRRALSAGEGFEAIEDEPSKKDPTEYARARRALN